MTQTKEQIQKQAKQILDNFAESLSKVKLKEEKIKKIVGGFREEGPGLECDPDFRKRIFAKAPEIDGDFIIAEKKEW